MGTQKYPPDNLLGHSNSTSREKITKGGYSFLFVILKTDIFCGLLGWAVWFQPLRLFFVSLKVF